MVKFFTNSKDNSYTKVKLTNSNIDIIKNTTETKIIINPVTLTQSQTIIFALELTKSIILLNLKKITSPKRLILNSFSNMLNKLSNKLKVE